MNTDAGMYLWIGLMSAVVFISIYGMKILNPAYTDWLQYNLHFYDIDGIVVGYVHTIDGFQEIERGNER